MYFLLKLSRVRIERQDGVNKLDDLRLQLGDFLPVKLDHASSL
jgi:hypothetical protein